MSSNRNKPQPRRPKTPAVELHLVKLSYDCWSGSFWSWLQSPPGIQTRHQIRRFHTTLSELVDHPDDPALQVELVMSMDVAATVNRMESRDDAYVTDRGDHGRVAGRTLPLEDRIAVILDACNLLAGNPASGRLSFNSTGAKLMKDILIHEAQHALIRQRGTYSYGEQAADGDVALRFFRHCGVLIVDEYRAVASAREQGTAFPVRAHNVIEGLEVLDRGLRTAHAAYTSDGDLRSLRDAVCMFAELFWVTSLGYFAGGQPMDAPLPASLFNHPLWQQYVGHTWRPIEAALRRAPGADARAADLPVGLLPMLVDELAALLDLSLRQFGFALEDHPEGSYLGILPPYGPGQPS